MTGTPVERQTTGDRSAGGYRNVPHTADVRIEAWAPTREQCLSWAVSGLVEGFVDRTGVEPTSTDEYRVPPGNDPDLLVTVLDEVIYRLETEGRVPLDTDVRVDGDGLLVRWRFADAGELEAIGAVPKAISLHELRFGPENTGWRCAFTVDV